MTIHAKSRPIFYQLNLPGPLKKHFSNESYEIDLSNSTNPYLGHLAEYPDLGQEILKKTYLDVISSLNPPESFSPRAEDLNLSHDNVLFTVGSGEGIDLLLRTFGEPNQDTICVTSPSFPAYEHWAKIHGLKVVSVPLQGDQYSQLDVDKIASMNPKLTFICNPNNPTGTVLDKGIIQKLCERLEGFVVVDEAYIELSDQSSAIFDLPSYSNLIVLRTLSKAWGMAGLRCGAIVAEPSVINTLRYIQIPFGLSTNSIDKIQASFNNPADIFESWKKIKADRDLLIQEALSLKAVSKVFKSQSNFILFILRDFQKTVALLRQHNILVADCSSNIPNAIKVSIGPHDHNMKFLEVLKQS